MRIFTKKTVIITGGGGGVTANVRWGPMFGSGPKTVNAALSLPAVRLLGVLATAGAISVSAVQMSGQISVQAQLDRFVQIGYPLTLSTVQGALSLSKVQISGLSLAAQTALNFARASVGNLSSGTVGGAVSLPAVAASPQLVVSDAIKLSSLIIPYRELSVSAALAGTGVSVFVGAGSKTWNAPKGVATVKSELWGGGGGGGSALINGGGGGGGGAYARHNAAAVTALSNYTIVIGSGGTVNADGADSTATWDSVTTVAHRGVRGVSGSAGGQGAGGSGGTVAGSTGDARFAGGNGGGGGGTQTSGGGGGGAAGDANAGNAGASNRTAGTGGAVGGGDGGIGGGTNVASAAGVVPGGGGGGASATNAGSLGASGRAVITWAISTA